MVAKMANEVGTAIRKSIVISFLPCLVAFLGFHPYMVLHFLNVFVTFAIYYQINILCSLFSHRAAMEYSTIFHSSQVMYLVITLRGQV